MSDMINKFEGATVGITTEDVAIPEATDDDTTFEVPMTPDQNAGLPVLPKGLNNDFALPGANQIEDPEGDEEKTEEEEIDLTGGRPNAVPFDTFDAGLITDPSDGGVWLSMAAQY